MDTKIKKIQTAIFTRNFNISNDLDRAALLTEINKHAGAIFNGAPTQLPIPNDAPPEFPRFILNSIDNKFSCQVSLSRVDVFYNVPVDYIENDDQLFEAHKNNIQNIFNFLVNKKIIVNRVGFITIVEKILEPVDGNGLDYLRNNFIRDGKFSDPKELVLNYNNSTDSDLKNLEMNNLISIKANKLANSSIIIQTDINTAAERMAENNFNQENFNEIIDYAIEKTNGLKSNFPNI